MQEKLHVWMWNDHIWYWNVVRNVAVFLVLVRIWRPCDDVSWFYDVSQTIILGSFSVVYGIWYHSILLEGVIHLSMVFHSVDFSCLDAAVSEVLNTEQTQELRVPDGQPDIGRIVGTWGQVILRGKDKRRDSVSVNGGVMVWILYTGEDDASLHCLDTWIPFQMHMDFPEGVGDGKPVVSPLLRFVDSRSVSPRKVMVRTGVAALIQNYISRNITAAVPDTGVDHLEVLRRSYPIRLSRYIGEKNLAMEEEVSAQDVGHVIYYTLEPEITEQKVLANKTVYRGNGNLHMLYFDNNGSIRSHDQSVLFSQVAEMEDSFGQDAKVSVCAAVTNLEYNRDSHSVSFELAFQYLIDDISMVETIEDAYIPGRELQVERATLEFPAVLEKRREHLDGEQMVSAIGTQIIDTKFLPDFPRQYSGEKGYILEAPGTIQLIYYGEDGNVYGTSSRWEGKTEVPSDESVHLSVIPCVPGSVQTSFQNGGIQIHTDQSFEITCWGGNGIPMITSVEFGDVKEPDPGRPSLILRKAGDDSLWTIARLCGSTVDRIMKANNLTGEPASGQMLLIPVC